MEITKEKVLELARKFNYKVSEDAAGELAEEQKGKTFEELEAYIKKLYETEGESEKDKHNLDSKNLDAFPEELRDYIKKLRSENASRRKKNTELEAELSIQKDETIRLRTLSESQDGGEKVKQLNKDIEKLRKELNEVKPQAESWKNYETPKRDAIKAQLAEKWKDSFGNLPLQDLEHLASSLGELPASPLPTDNKNNYGRGNTGQKSSEEKIATLYKS